MRNSNLNFPNRIVRDNLEVLNTASIKSIGALIGFPNAQVFAADERLNFGGSHKDRPVRLMLQRGIESGQITSETTVVDYTTGSLGISLAKICQAVGLNVHIVMPADITIERESLIREAGASLTLTAADQKPEDTANGISDHLVWVRGAVQTAQEICATQPNHYLLNQSVNLDNKAAFYGLAEAFALRFKDHPLDYMVAASGMGATIIGIAEVFKRLKLPTQIVAVNVEKSADLWALKHNQILKHEPHKLFGTGPGASSPITKGGHQLVDHVARVNDEECYSAAHELMANGLSVGPTSAANIIVTRNILRRNPNARIGTILFDHADRYKSVGLT